MIIKKLFAFGTQGVSTITIEHITGKNQKLPLTEVLVVVKSYMRKNNIEALKVKDNVFRTKKNELCDTVLFLNKKDYEPLTTKNVVLDYCKEFHIINYGLLAKQLIDEKLIAARSERCQQKTKKKVA